MMQCAISRREGTVLFALIACIAAVDQLIKRVLSQFPEEQIIINLEPFFQIVRTRNRGAAFSIMSGRVLFLLIITTIMVACLLVVIVFFRSITPSARAALAVLAGGGIGNWLDRLFEGAVTDYIRLRFVAFPVFNIADICISISIAYLILLLLLNRFEMQTGEKNGTDY